MERTRLWKEATLEKTLRMLSVNYKKDCTLPPCIDLAMALHGFGIDNIAAQNAMAGSKALHAR